MKKVILVISLLIPFFGTQAQDKSLKGNTDCKIEEAAKGDCEEGTIRNETTQFPESSPASDYQVKGYQVKLAFPTATDSCRIWVKGNEQLKKVQIFNKDNKPLSKISSLQAPFFTTIINIPSHYNEVTVKFADLESDLPASDKAGIAYPRTMTALAKEEDQFSMLFYGCFQPFKVNKETGKSEVLHEKDTLNYVIRQMLTAIADEREFNYYPFEQEQPKTSKLLHNPKVIIGGGDQIYTDAGYAELDFKDHPLSAWAHKCSDPYPLLDTLEYAKHLNRCYLHFNSFDCFQKVHAKLPSISTWDDHEIRDGWGSHGDEYNDDGTVSQKLKPYYFLSRQAFIEHQYAVGPNNTTNKTITSNQSLEQITIVNGVDLFVMDLRSNRNNCAEMVMSAEQLHSFQNWCKELEDNKEVVIVSSIPFFYASSAVITALAEDVYEGELRDDIIDSWASRSNKAQRDTIINELIKLRKRNIKPILLSGDVHIGALITAWYKNPDTDAYEKLCFEMISSGLSHESLGEARAGFKNGLKKRSRKVKKDDPALSVNEIDIYPTFDFTRGRLNFGALEFTKNKNTKASLFIIGDDEKQVMERELILDWKEPYRSYRKNCKKPILWYVLPWKWFERELPEVSYNTVFIPELLKKE